MSDAVGTPGRSSAASIPDAVITRISRLGFGIRVVGVVAALFACWYIALHPDGTTTKDVFVDTVWWIFALLFTPILLWQLWVRLRQLILHDGRAVWIEGGRLKFVDDAGPGLRFQSLEAAGIRELSLDFLHVSWGLWRNPCVAVKMKDGRGGACIMTLFFTDSAPVVRAKLAEALSLPKAS